MLWVFRITCIVIFGTFIGTVVVPSIFLYCCGQDYNYRYNVASVSIFFSLKTLLLKKITKFYVVYELFWYHSSLFSAFRSYCGCMVKFCLFFRVFVVNFVFLKVFRELGSFVNRVKRWRQFWSVIIWIMYQYIFYFFNSDGISVRNQFDCCNLFCCWGEWKLRQWG